MVERIYRILQRTETGVCRGLEKKRENMTEYHDKYRILHKIKNRLFNTDQILILVETLFFFFNGVNRVLEPNSSNYLTWIGK